MSLVSGQDPIDCDHPRDCAWRSAKAMRLRFACTDGECRREREPHGSKDGETIGRGGMRLTDAQAR